MPKCNNYLTSLFLLFHLIFSLTLFAQGKNDINFDLELQMQILKESQNEYEALIKKNKILNDHKGWKKFIKSALDSLSSKNSKPNHPITFTIVENPDFNASAYPTGQIIIHSGLLEQLDELAQNSKKKSSSSMDEIKEGLIASILSHELAHYYSQHTLQSVKKFIQSNEKSKKELKKIRFLQEDELEADRSGLMMMKAAGYKLEYMLEILNYLNDIYQAELEQKANKKKNPYFLSHPTPNERLSQIDSEKKELFAWLNKMEIVFANVQMGNNLDTAAEELLLAQEKYLDNVDIMKALAVCYHKLWEKSAHPKDLKLKSIIDMPGFRNKMIFQGSFSTKAAKIIPGDSTLYYKAISYYQDVLKKTDDVNFLSNYAVILSYSPKLEDEKIAREKAETSYKLSKEIQTGNNLAVVYYICSDPAMQKNAIKVLERIASNLSSKTLGNFKASDPESIAFIREFKNELEKKKSLNPDYIDEDFTPILNLALLENYNKNSEKSKQYATEYLNYHESNSIWSKYLIDQTEVKIEERMNDFSLEVKGIKVGGTLKDLLDKWGKYDSQEVLDGVIVCSYDKLKAKVYLDSGFILEIHLNGTESPAVNKQVSVGKSFLEAKNVLGNHFKRNSNYHNYFGKENVSLLIQGEEIKQIVVYK